MWQKLQKLWGGASNSENVGLEPLTGWNQDYTRLESGDDQPTFAGLPPTSLREVKQTSVDVAPVTQGGVASAKDAKQLPGPIRFTFAEKESLEHRGFRPLHRHLLPVMPNLAIGLFWAGSATAVAFSIASLAELNLKIDAAYDALLEPQSLLGGGACIDGVNEKYLCGPSKSGYTPEFIEACADLVTKFCHLSNKPTGGQVVGILFGMIPTLLLPCYIFYGGGYWNYSLTEHDLKKLKYMGLSQKSGESAEDYTGRLLQAVREEGFRKRYSDIDARVERLKATMQVFNGLAKQSHSKGLLLEPNLVRLLQKFSMPGVSRSSQRVDLEVLIDPENDDSPRPN